jgi:hypothetical protein
MRRLFILIAAMFSLLGSHSVNADQDNTPPSSQVQPSVIGGKEIHMNYLDAAYRKDIDKAISYFTQSQQPQLQANKKVLEPLFAVLPKDVKLFNETRIGDEVLTQGARDGILWQRCWGYENGSREGGLENT